MELSEAIKEKQSLCAREFDALLLRKLRLDEELKLVVESLAKLQGANDALESIKECVKSD